MRVRARVGCRELVEKKARLIGKQWSIYVAELNEYHVYGLSWYNESPAFGTGPYYEILDDFGNLTSVPYEAFEVVDDRVDSNWIVKAVDGNCFVWPDLFHEKYFFDDLSEGVPDVIAKFEVLKNGVRGN